MQPDFVQPAAPAVGRGVNPPRARLLCLPFAGGSASAYAAWGHALPSDIELCTIELPGRGALFNEPALRSMTALADFVMASCAGYLDRPLVLFGHSMGAVLALELARRLLAHGTPPAALIVSGCRAPHLPSPRNTPLFALPTDALLQELVKIGGLPRGFLDIPGSIDLFLPTIRADLQSREEWSAPVDALPVPIHVLGGRADILVPPADLDAWAKHTMLPLSVTLFEGAHFFIREHERQVLAYLVQAVRSSVGLPCSHRQETLS